MASNTSTSTNNKSTSQLHSKPKHTVTVKQTDHGSVDDGDRSNKSKTQLVKSRLESYSIPTLDEWLHPVLSDLNLDPDYWIKRDSRLIPCTGPHPFNAEVPSHILDQHLINPNGLHYVRNHGAVPRLAWEQHRLTITGMVEKEMIFTMDELISKFESITIPVTITCDGIRREELNRIQHTKMFPYTIGSTSTAYWTGIRLSQLLSTVKFISRKDNKTGGIIKACHLWMQGADELPNGNYSVSFPLNRAMDPRQDIIIAYRMNGQPIHPDNGYPIRMVIPGVVGARSVKWLTRLTISDREDPSPNQKEPRLYPADVGYAQEHAWQSRPELALYDMNLNSCITHPANDEIINITAQQSSSQVQEPLKGATSARPQQSQSQSQIQAPSANSPRNKSTSTSTQQDKPQDNKKLDKRQDQSQDRSQQDKNHDSKTSAAEHHPHEYEIRGFAYSGGGRAVIRVEISLNEGETWIQTHLTYPKTAPQNEDDLVFGTSSPDSTTRSLQRLENVLQTLQLESTSIPANVHHSPCWTWCHWSCWIPLWQFSKTPSIVVRAWDTSGATQPQHMSWNLLGLFHNSWYRVKLQSLPRTNPHIIPPIKCIHPVIPGGSEGGWMEDQNPGPDLKRNPGILDRLLPGSVWNGLQSGRLFSLQQVRAHSTKDDCWLIMDRQVYDVTPYLSTHPGGPHALLIQSALNQDAGHLFRSIHGADAHEITTRFLIGQMVFFDPTPLYDEIKDDDQHLVLLRPDRWIDFSLYKRVKITHDSYLFTFTMYDKRIHPHTIKQMLISMHEELQRKQRHHVSVTSQRAYHYEYDIKQVDRDRHPLNRASSIEEMRRNKHQAPTEIPEETPASDHEEQRPSSPPKEVPSGGSIQLGLHAGQHLLLGAIIHNKWVVRPYTPTRPCYEDEHFDDATSSEKQHGNEIECTKKEDGQQKESSSSSNRSLVSHESQQQPTSAHMHPPDYTMFELLVKIYRDSPTRPGGLMSQHLENMKLGDIIQVKGPTGHVFYHGRGVFSIHGVSVRATHLSMICGGTGLTPCYQLIRHICRGDDDTKIRLIYANSTPADALMRHELEEMAHEKPQFELWMTASHIDPDQHKDWPYDQGMISIEMFEQHLFPADIGHVVFTCGPPPMMYAAASLLQQLGYKGEAIIEF